ncbi:MAG: MBL fold metallo-hydrolase [Bryobacteraceae bacterium]|jgi:beta-lactamase superfamily II metal-dependent hydrolase
MQRTLLFLLAFSVAGIVHAAKALDIFFVDVEGGQATLIVTPAGQSLLVDTGWRGFNGRDADRIVQEAKKAHIKKIDYVLITHYHRDHVGGAPQLADRLPVGAWLDHGPLREDSKVTREDFADYQRISKAQHLVMKPGDHIPLKGVDVTIVSADGAVIGEPLTGGGQDNPLCASNAKREVDTTENARSVGFLLRYGSFRFVDLGDLTWNKELELACPANKLGTVDVYLVTHHGANLSNSPAIVDALHPRVAIMDNGARKGGSPEAWQTVRNAPGLEDIWQLHYAMEGGTDHNAPDPFVANVDEVCQGKALRLAASEDGSFSVTNTRNNYSKTYPASGR